MSLKFAKLFDGVRQDSGDEYQIGNMVISRYKELNIDPTTKTIVFSNALNFNKYLDIANYFKGRIKISAGIGTNLTNDTEFAPANIVMKLSKCRINSKHDWRKCIKISDDLGKHLGDDKEFEIAKYQLGI
jgi:nicotinate phosphoribosyltransferase